MRTETTYAIYATVKFKDIEHHNALLKTFYKASECDNFRISHEFYKTAQLRYLKEYGEYPTFPQIREIFDKDDKQRDIQKLLTGNDEYAILQIKDFVYMISNIWDESYYSIIEDVYQFAEEQKIVTVEYIKKEL